MSLKHIHSSEFFPFSGNVQIKLNLLNVLPACGSALFMPRFLGPGMRTSFAFDLTYWLVSVVIMIRMFVAPIPIRRLLLLFQFSKGPIRLVFLAEVLTIEMVFVVIPIVVVVVGTVVESVVVLVVATIFFLASIVLRPRRGAHYCWRGEGHGQNKGTEKTSKSTVHVFFLLARGSHLGALGTEGICICDLLEDVRFCTPA